MLSSRQALCTTYLGTFPGDQASCPYAWVVLPNSCGLPSRSGWDSMDSMS